MLTSKLSLLSSCIWLALSGCHVDKLSPVLHFMQSHDFDLKVVREASNRDFETVVLQEAEGEPLDGMVAVAGVILDRVADPRWPHSIVGVIHQPYQFEGMDKPIREYDPRAVEQVKIAIEMARNGARPCGEVFWFHTPAVQPDWAGALQVSCTIGNHIFYGDKS